MQRAVWGLPQASILANKLLKKRLTPQEYFECKQTPRSLETYHQAHHLHVSRWCFWRKIWMSGGHWPPHCMHQEKLWIHHWLGCRSLLWNLTQVGLWQAYARHLHARVHHQATPKIQVCLTPQTILLPLQAASQTIRHLSTTPSPPDHLNIWAKTTSNMSNTSSRAFPSTHMLLIWLSSWPSAQLRANNQRAWIIPCSRRSNFLII